MCGPCRAGRPASCENIRALGVFQHGALAPLIKAPAEFTFPLSEGPSSAIASLIEPLACVVNSVNKANPRPGESAIIFGAGAIGCLFLAMFKAAGAGPVIVVEPQAARAAVATAVGADLVVTPDELDARTPRRSCRMARMSSSTPLAASSGRPSSTRPWAAGSPCSA